ncbi:hypothetical protein EBZ39_14465 [bacterium]|nr:hypothetical protein [bacterium]
MARKKKQVEEVAPELEMKQPSPAEEHIPPTLTQEELFKLRAFESESRVAGLEAAMLTIERDGFLRKYDPEGKLARWAESIHARNEMAKQKKLAYIDAISKIEKRLGISMKDYSFDDETGTLTWITKDE